MNGRGYELFERFPETSAFSKFQPCQPLTPPAPRPESFEALFDACEASSRHCPVIAADGTLAR